MSQADVVVVGSEAFCSRLTSRLSRGLDVGIASIVADGSADDLLGQELVNTGLIVIDARLPGGRGLALCAKVAEISSGQQVMMVDEQGDDTMALQSLKAGAVDYFSRSDNHAELLARVRAHMRNYAASDKAHTVVGPFLFQAGKRTLMHRQTGHRVWLTAKETRLLQRLQRDGGKVVSSADLLRTVWGVATAHDTNHTLQTHIYRLRIRDKTA